MDTNLLPDLGKLSKEEIEKRIPGFPLSRIHIRCVEETGAGDIETYPANLPGERVAAFQPHPSQNLLQTGRCRETAAIVALS